MKGVECKKGEKDIRNKGIKEGEEKKEVGI